MKRYQVTVTTVREQVIIVTAANAGEALYEAGVRRGATTEREKDRYIVCLEIDREPGEAA